MKFNNEAFTRKIQRGFDEISDWVTCCRCSAMIKRRREQIKEELRLLDVTEKFNEKQLKRLNAKAKAKQRYSS
ncbi:MAG: hypothetical protein DMF62_10525 [Acidobacteria bacterium]|nr:MAG: hypothetical protein DMF62_10525 [Acidobacteriota bacterium]